MKRLVVTADDLGLTSGVVEGIGKAHRSGIVTSASLMVNGPAAPDAFRLARETASLSVGLHLVLTFGRPVGAAGPLADLFGPDGAFLGIGSEAHSRAPASAVAAELEAQIDCFAREVGRAPAHLDGHHHVHALPGVLHAVIGAARRLKIPVRAPDPETREKLLSAEVKTTANFVDRFYGEGSIGVGSLIAILESLPDGVSELMCHPAQGDPELAGLSRYSRERSIELRSLTAPEVRNAVRRLGIELIPSSAL